MASQSISALPPHATFTVALNKIIRDQSCTPVIKGVRCEFSYQYDFQKNEGYADLVAIGGTTVNIRLYPIGLSGRYAFMSDMQPTPVVIHGQNVYLYRVLMTLFTDGTRTALVMFGQTGDCIEATDNYKQDAEAEKHLGISA